MGLEDLTKQLMSQTADTSAAAASAPDEATGSSTATNMARALSQPSGAPQPTPNNVALPTDGSGSFQDKLATSLNKAKQAAAIFGHTPSWAQLWMGATTDALATSASPGPAPVSKGAWESVLANRDDVTQPTQAPIQQQKRGGLQNLTANLGDAAAAEGGQGLFSGFSRAAAARTKRTAEEQQNDVATATANARMITQQALVHKMGEDAINEHIKQAQADQADIIKGPPGGKDGTVDYKDLSLAELKQKMIPGPGGKAEIDMTRQTPFASRRDFIGNDANGIPRYQTRYSVVTPAPETIITPDQAKLINTYLDKNFPTEEKEGAANKGLQVMPGAQANYLLQQAYSAQAAEQKRDLDLKKNKLEADNINDMAGAKAVGTQPAVTKALSQAHTSATDPGGIVDAYNILRKGGIFNDPKSGVTDESYKMWAVGTKDTDKRFSELQENAAKEAIKKTEEADNKWKKYDAPGAFEGGNGPAAVGEITARLADKENPPSPEDAKQLRKYLEMAKGAVAQTEFFKRSQSSAEQAAKEGDPVAAGELLYHNATSLTELKSRGATSQFIVDAIKSADNLAQKEGKTYSSSVQDGQYHQAQSPTLVNQFGNANSLLDKGGTIDQVIAANQNLKPGRFPVWNTLKDVLEYHAGDPELAAYQSAVIGMADDFAKVMGGGAGSDHARDQMIKTFSYNMNQAQLGAAAQAAKNAVTSQVRAKVGTNPFLMQMYGYNLPEYHAANQNLKGGGQAPADLAGKATGVQAYTKGGVTKMFWHDALGAPLREAKPGEVPK